MALKDTSGIDHKNAYITEISRKDPETGRRSLIEKNLFQDGKISFLSEEGIESIEGAEVVGLCMKRFKGDLQTKDLVYEDLTVGQLLRIGGMTVKVTKVGKSCHAEECPAYDKAATCVMLHETMFGQVVVEGHVNINDRIEVV